MRVYEYSQCSTCRKALQFLKKHGIAYDAVPIVDQPPTVAELKAMLRHVEGEIRKLFNTSGVLYREMKISVKLPEMSDLDALKLLAGHGKLVKRPFLIGKDARGKPIGLVGFKEDEWKKTLT